ncbi:hypothetical protein C8Q72DRAFT_617955 [Fomitopsis betulina]|nr:hypothetical protein C8Q72DRAFT_617955 [Fomitopsis betulina]
MTHTCVDRRDGINLVPGKRSRADSTVAKARATAKGARASPDTPPEVSDTERRSPKKAKVGSLKPATFNKSTCNHSCSSHSLTTTMCYHLIGRIYLAANLSESDNEDIQPPPPPPLPRTKGIPQRSRTEARTGNAEELFDDDGEDEQYERGEEEDDGEDLENHEACVDFDAEQVTFTSPGAHLNSETANGRSAGCSSSVASSHPTEPPGTDHDDFDMHEQDSTQQADDNRNDSDSGPTRSAYAKARTQCHVVNTSSGDGLDDMVEKEIVVPVPLRQVRTSVTRRFCPV